MENGDPVTQLLAGPAGRVYLIFGCQPRASGNGASHQPHPAGVAPTILLTTEPLAWAMGNGEVSLAPASRFQGPEPRR